MKTLYFRYIFFTNDVVYATSDEAGANFYLPRTGEHLIEAGDIG